MGVLSNQCAKYEHTPSKMKEDGCSAYLNWTLAQTSYAYAETIVVIYTVKEIKKNKSRKYEHTRPKTEEGRVKRLKTKFILCDLDL